MDNFPTHGQEGALTSNLSSALRRGRWHLIQGDFSRKSLNTSVGPLPPLSLPPPIIIIIIIIIIILIILRVEYF